MKEIIRRHTGSGGIRAALLRLGIALLIMSAGRGFQARADILYVSSLAGYIERVDTSTNTITTVLNTHGVAVDSLIFAPGDNIVFSVPNAGAIGIFNTDTQDLRYVHGFVEPRDITLEPSGTSVLVSDNGDQYVKRVDLTADSPVPVKLPSWLDNIDGITYDNAGHLFVVQSWAGYVAQIDPTDGHIIKRLQCGACSFGIDQLDGMTFDPVTGALWVASTTWNGLWEFNTSLNTSTLLAANKIPSPDGVESDGAGDIFAAAQGNSYVYEYNIASHTTTQLTSVPFIDDIAPVTGLGSPPAATSAVPEPSAMLLLGTVLLYLGVALNRRKLRPGK